MSRFVDLVVVEGPDLGMRYTIEEGSFRVLGRSEDDNEMTQQLTPEGDRQLNPDQVAVVETLLAKGPQTQVRVGTSRRGADVLLNDTAVSRTHAMVFVDRGHISVADLMSTNGTKVNQGQVQDVDLKEGDRVQLGKTHLEVQRG
jgi:predicted component of type VI protein secretion system